MKLFPRRATTIAVVGLCLGLGACGDAQPGRIAARLGGDATFSSTPSPSRTASSRSSPSTHPRATATTKARPAAGGTGPSPVALPFETSPDVPVSATLSTTCFRRGGLVTLRVHTRPKASVGYIAMYSDNGSGAPKPTGKGYGGNASGLTTEGGDYVSTFTVSADAPPGPGRVDVFVGWDSKWGYAGPTFTVARADGAC